MDPGYSFEKLVQAYFDCRRHKRTTASALRFEQGLERNLIELHEELSDGSYRPGKSICFAISRPRAREVWAAGFRDRVVHHLLYNQIADRFHRRFIADSSACIPGRGTLYAAAPAQAQEDARDAERFLSETDYDDLSRFDGMAQDGEGYDIPKERMKRLAELGVVRWLGRDRYGVTAFGQYVLKAWSGLPLETYAETSARCDAEFKARIERLNAEAIDAARAAQAAAKEGGAA